ncbi:MAG: hypothetical protein KF901_16060 [Myxococcales bacterium]|nr:hypothetical protein [Myxococcales bacterium]
MIRFTETSLPVRSEHGVAVMFAGDLASHVEDLAGSEEIASTSAPCRLNRQDP